MYSEPEWRKEAEHNSSLCLECNTIGKCFIEVRFNGLMIPPLGGCHPCPKCNTVGFYSVRWQPMGVPMSAAERKYRMCKFCGLVQDVDGEERYYKMFYHDNCSKLQGFPPFEHKAFGCVWGTTDKWGCGLCGETISNIVKSPVDDGKHPYSILRDRIKERLEKLR